MDETRTTFDAAAFREKVQKYSGKELRKNSTLEETRAAMLTLQDLREKGELRRNSHNGHTGFDE